VAIAVLRVHGYVVHGELVAWKAVGSIW